MTEAPVLLSTSASSSTTFSIAELVGRAEGGKLEIPSFQRSFLWQGADVRLLFDSVYRGFPIGTLLLWQRELAPDSARLGSLEPDRREATTGYTVVDGQQRLTSLVGALSATARRTDDRFEVFFDLGRRRFTGLVRGAAPRRAIPVREALETRRLLTWIREHDADLESDDLDVADRLGGALRDYRIPAYVVESDDEQLLREVFDRMNGAGRRLSRAQVFHALFASDSTEPGSIAGVNASLQRHGFGQLPDERVVSSVLAVRGGDVVRDLHEEFSSAEDPADAFEIATAALGLAIGFLKEQGIPHVLLMPSTFPLPVLAAFFHLHPQPDPWVRALLARWLWRGLAHGFDGGSGPALRRAVAAVNPTKGKPEHAPDEFAAVKALLEQVKAGDAPSLSLTGFRTDKAESRLLLLGLVVAGPLSPDGTPVDVSSALDRRGASAVEDLVPGHRADIGARGFWPSETPGPTGKEDVVVLASHGIESDAAEALREGRLDDFVHLRGKRVAALARDVLAAKTSSGARTTPPLASLVVPDPPVQP